MRKKYRTYTWRSICPSVCPPVCPTDSFTFLPEKQRLSLANTKLFVLEEITTTVSPPDQDLSEQGERRTPGIHFENTVTAL